MNNVVWILQIFLAVVFLWHGWLYTTWPPSAQKLHDKLHPGQSLGLPPALRTFTGISELLAAAGLILPWLAGILPWLTPLAAFGLIVVMLGSAAYHLVRHKYRNVAISLIFVALCVIVAYGRLESVTIPSFAIL